MKDGRKTRVKGQAGRWFGVRENRSTKECNLAVTWCDSTREALNVKQGTIKEGEQRATAKVINDSEKGGHYGLGKCPCKSNVHDSTSEEGVDGRR